MDVTLQWVNLTKVVQVKDTTTTTKRTPRNRTKGGNKSSLLISSSQSWSSRNGARTDQTLTGKGGKGGELPAITTTKQHQQGGEIHFSKGDDNNNNNKNQHTTPSLFQQQHKMILNQVSGQAKAGEILAIMGPSGSGKTSLLDCIASRSKFQYGNLFYQSQSVSSGTLVTDDNVRSSIIPSSSSSPSSPRIAALQKHLKRNMAYIQQNDIFFPHLTVLDQLTYTALLRLGDDIPHSTKNKQVQHMIQLLQLQKCQHTPIRLISGGERKRVNIATELLTNPSILLLDEPTSGLDSTSALSLMTLLSSLATKFHKTIITSIHQPSSKTYFSFHKVLFLTDGCVVYYGTPQKSLEYLQRLDLTCPDGYNAADHWMDLLVVSHDDGDADDDTDADGDADDADNHHHQHHHHHSSSFVPLSSIHMQNAPGSMTINGVERKLTSLEHGLQEEDSKGNDDDDDDDRCCDDDRQEQDTLLLKQQRPILANTTYPSMMDTHDDTISNNTPRSASRNDGISTSHGHMYWSGRSDSTTTTTNTTSYQTAKKSTMQKEDSIMTTMSSFPIHVTVDDDISTTLMDVPPGDGTVSRSAVDATTSNATSSSRNQNGNTWKRKSSNIQTFMSRLSTMTIMSEKPFNILDETKKKREEYLALTTTKAQLINAWDVDEFALEMQLGTERGHGTSFANNTMSSQPNHLTEKKFNTRWTKQFQVLLHRSLKNSKCAVLTKINFIKSIALGILSGLLWFQMPNDEQHVQDRGSFLFFASTYWIFDGIFEAIFAFPMERDVIFKERASGSYHLSAYFLAKTVSEMPTRLLLPSLYWSISYWMTNLNPRVDVFFSTMSTTLLSVLTGESYGLLCGALVMDFEKSMTYMIVISLTTMAAGGFYVDNIPSFIEWLKYLSPFKFGYEASQIMVFDRDVPCDGSGYLRLYCSDGAEYVSKENVLKVLNSENTVGLNIGILFVLMIVPRYLAFLALKSKKATERS